MGFLASPKVEECSASDLVGQYVGHTGPKTKKLFEKALGQVLFLDEAYRLGEGRFAQEAVDEIVGLLTHDAYKGKIVVILAGYERDINKLLSVNDGLSSRFQESIAFKNFPPKDLLNILNKKLLQSKITLADLHDHSSKGYSAMTSAVEDLSGLPSWGNARDMETLAKQMSSFVLKQLPENGQSGELKLHAKDALKIMLSMLGEKRGRSNLPPLPRSRYNDMQDELSSNSAPPPPPPTSSSQQSSTIAPPPPPPPPENKDEAKGPQPPPTSTSKPASIPSPPRPHPSASSNAPSASQSSSKRSDHKKTPSRTQPSPIPSDLRDPGVSDTIWNQLQADKQAAEQAARVLEEGVRQAQRVTQRAIQDQERKAAAARAALRDEAAAKDAAARQAAQRRRLQLEQQQEAARVERQRLTDMLKAKQAENARRKQEEAKVQTTLRNMGVCPQGFQWIEQSDGGYRCRGGSHYVSKSRLGIRS